MHPNPRIYIKHHQTLCCQSLCHPHRNWSSLAIPSGPEPSRTFRGDRPTLEARFPKRRERWGGFLPFLGAKLEPRFSQIQVLNGQLTNIKQKMFEEILPDMVFNILETKHEPSAIDLLKILPCHTPSSSCLIIETSFKCQRLKDQAGPSDSGVRVYTLE